MRQKVTPLQFLKGVLDKALKYDIITEVEYHEIFSQEDSIQDNINYYRNLLRNFEDTLGKTWVLAIPKQKLKNGELYAYYERINDETFETYYSATTFCGSIKKSSPMRKGIRIVELKNSLPPEVHYRKGLTVNELISILETPR
eukprot:Pgem_evm1s208